MLCDVHGPETLRVPDPALRRSTPALLAPAIPATEPIAELSANPTRAGVAEFVEDNCRWSVVGEVIGVRSG